MSSNKGENMKVIGFLLLIGAAIFGFFTLSEYSRYQELVADGNPFAGLLSNSYVYCGGIAMTADLTGIGFLLVPGKAKPVAPTAGGSANPYEGMVWDGKRWVDAPQYPATPHLPPATATE
ncbi:MAG: hypothetical protein NTX29_09105 [Actinobacteria bacterium]|nr:hypothetical protein [Actinomycetota bacterium]